MKIRAVTIGINVSEQDLSSCDEMILESKISQAKHVLDEISRVLVENSYEVMTFN